MDDVTHEEHGIRLAIEGCGHGTLHAIYASVTESCKQKGWPGVDLLIIGGDFQSVRNAYDLNCVSMPAKYRAMCDFHEYYSGQRKAPYLTLFVGGNHEASNYLAELYYGGWVAPNIFYLGAANVLQLGPSRIAGLSGIWKGFDYRKPHFERLPYNESDLKSVYHVRELDIRKLLQIQTQVDIGISHDWPQGVEWQGNWEQLFRRKNHFEPDARSGRLGSVAARQVAERLRPRYWFSAHLHCKFAAIMSHANQQSPPESLSQGQAAALEGDEIELSDLGHDEANGPTKNDDEIELDLDGEIETASDPPLPANGTKSSNTDEIDLDMELDDPNPAQQPAHLASNGPDLQAARAALPASFQPRPPPEKTEHPPAITNLTTHFLALDKCLPNRDFLQLFTIPTESSVSRPLRLSYDPEWLAITRVFALNEPPIFGNPDAKVVQAKSQAQYRDLISTERDWVDQHFKSEQDLLVPENFEIVAPVYDGGDWREPQYQANGGGLREYADPQTASFCQKLAIPNPLELSEEERVERMARGPRPDIEGERFRDQGGRGRGRGNFRGGGRGRGGRGRGRGGRGFGHGR